MNLKFLTILIILLSTNDSFGLGRNILTTGSDLICESFSGRQSNPTRCLDFYSGIETVPPGEFSEPKSISSKGRVACFLQNKAAHCVNATNRPARQFPFDSKLLRQETDAIQIVALENGFCLLSKNKVECDGNQNNPILKKENYSSIKIEDPIQMDAGADTACVLDRLHGVQCWGAKTAGLDQIPGNLKRPSMLTMGAFFACVLDQDVPVCWGLWKNNEMDFKIGEIKGRPNQLASGSYYYCINSTDHTSLCKGWSPNSQLNKNQLNGDESAVISHMALGHHKSCYIGVSEDTNSVLSHCKDNNIDSKLKRNGGYQIKDNKVPLSPIDLASQWLNTNVKYHSHVWANTNSPMNGQGLIDFHYDNVDKELFLAVRSLFEYQVVNSKNPYWAEYIFLRHFKKFFDYSGYPFIKANFTPTLSNYFDQLAYEQKFNLQMPMYETDHLILQLALLNATLKTIQIEVKEELQSQITATVVRLSEFLALASSGNIGLMSLAGIVGFVVEAEPMIEKISEYPYLNARSQVQKSIVDYFKTIK